MGPLRSTPETTHGCPPGNHLRRNTTLRQSCGCLPSVIASAGDRGRPAARRRPAPQAPARLVSEIVAAMQMPGAALPKITRRLCGRLVRAFHESLQAGGSSRFQAVLMATLQELELAQAVGVDMAQPPAQ